MESDFGHVSGIIDLECDDYVQDYSNYNDNRHEVIELTDDTVKCAINNDSRYKEKPVKLTKHQRRRENAKHTSKYKPTPFDKFYKQVLSWNRHNVTVPFALPELKESFTTPLSYFNYNGVLIYEECRAGICQELEANDRTEGKSCTLELEEVTQEPMKCTFMLHFKITQSVLDSMSFRGGSLFELTQGAKSNGKNTNDGVSSYFALVYSQLLEKGAKGVKVGDQLCMIIQNEHCSTINELVETNPLYFKSGKMWTGRCVGNMISFQREAFVCFEKPQLYFMHKLIGSKERQHIKFDEDEENASEEDDDEDEESTEVVTVTSGNEGSAETNEHLRPRADTDLEMELRQLRADGDCGGSSDHDSLNVLTGSMSTKKPLSVSSDASITIDKDDEDDEDEIKRQAQSSSAIRKVCAEKLKALKATTKSPPHFRRLLRESGSETSNLFVNSLNASQTAALKHITQDMFTVSIPHWSRAEKKRVADKTVDSGSRSDDESDEEVRNEQRKLTRKIDHTAESSVVFKNAVGALKVIQGPPGCGKTHLMSALLHVLFSANCRVLVCAPSNKAVCVALEKYLQSLRSGKVELEETSDEKKKNRQYMPRLAIVGVEDKIESNSNTVDIPSNWHAITDEPQNIADVMSTTYATRIAISIATMSDECTATDQLFLSPDFMGPPEYRKVYKEIQRINDKHSQIRDAIKERLSHFLKKHSNVLALHEDVEINLGHIEKVAFNSQHMAKNGIKQNGYALQKELSIKMAEVTRQLGFIHKFFKDDRHTMGVSDEYIRTAEILFCTLSSSGNVAVTRNFRNIDVLLIDEAAQAFEPELLIPMALQPDNMVLIGDPKQLPATIISQPIHHANLGLSCMQRLMTGLKFPFKMLSEQYRMHPEIASFSNRQFYKSRITNSKHVTQREDILVEAAERNGHWNFRKEMERASWATGHYSFINVEGTERKVAHMGNSLNNEAEANFVVSLVQFLKDFCGLHPAQQICVISFYSAQVALIKAKLGYADRIKVLSVDSFQGSECDCVILSFVRANDQNMQGFVKEYQRLNVALTRGKHMLFGIGSARTLTAVRGHMQRNGDYRVSNNIEQDSKRMRGVDGVVSSSLSRRPSSTSIASSSTTDADYDEDAMLKFNSVNSLYDMIRDAKERGRYFEGQEVTLSIDDMWRQRRISGPGVIPVAPQKVAKRAHESDSSEAEGQGQEEKNPTRRKGATSNREQQPQQSSYRDQSPPQSYLQKYDQRSNLERDAHSSFDRSHHLSRPLEKECGSRSDSRDRSDFHQASSRVLPLDIPRHPEANVRPANSNCAESHRVISTGMPLVLLPRAVVNKQRSSVEVIDLVRSESESTAVSKVETANIRAAEIRRRSLAKKESSRPVEEVEEEDEEEVASLVPVKLLARASLPDQHMTRQKTQKLASHPQVAVLPKKPSQVVVLSRTSTSSASHRPTLISSVEDQLQRPSASKHQWCGSDSTSHSDSQVGNVIASTVVLNRNVIQRQAPQPPVPEPSVTVAAPPHQMTAREAAVLALKNKTGSSGSKPKQAFQPSQQSSNKRAPLECLGAVTSGMSVGPVRPLQQNPVQLRARDVTSLPPRPSAPPPEQASVMGTAPRVISVMTKKPSLGAAPLDCLVPGYDRNVNRGAKRKQGSDSVASNEQNKRSTSEGVRDENNRWFNC